MTRARLIVLWIGILSSVAMLCFPPYLVAGTAHPIQYRSLWSPPNAISKSASGLMGLASNFTDYTPAAIDGWVLVLQIGVIALLTFGIIMTLPNRNSSP